MPLSSPEALDRDAALPASVVVVGGSRRTIDLLRIAALRSDDVILIGPSHDDKVRRVADLFAIEIRERNPLESDIREAGALLVAIGEIEAENHLVRMARRNGIPVFVADRALVSDFDLIAFLEQRPLARLAA